MGIQTLAKSLKTTSVVKSAATKLVTTIKSKQPIDAEARGIHKPLKEHVYAIMKNYYMHFSDSNPSEIYQLVLAQVEPPLLETTMEFTRGNQCKAAMLLGISRGTLRKKLEKYDLI